MENTFFTDEYFMKQALLEAKKALEMDEVPIGAVIVHNNKIISRGHNFTETLNDVTAHAEIQAITSATSFSGSKYLNECTIFITVEPCVMCAGALFWAQMGRIVFGAPDLKRGYSVLASEKILHPKTVVNKGVMQQECSDLLKKFFHELRKNSI